MKLQLHYGDCLDIMRTIPNDSVDMICTDLPYGTTACKWDSVIPFEALWAEYERITKKHAAIVLNASQPFTAMLIASNLRLFKYSWVWQKSRPSNGYQARFAPLKYHEDICVFYRATPTYNPIMRQGEKSHASKPFSARNNLLDQVKQLNANTSDQKFPSTIISIKSTDSTRNLHPTQKPLPLLEYLIKTYTNAGDTVLDSCMGSGTTGVACMNLARKFIGIEKDATYFQIASNRIREAVPKAANEDEMLRQGTLLL